LLAAPDASTTEPTGPTEINNKTASTRGYECNAVATRRGGVLWNKAGAPSQTAPFITPLAPSLELKSQQQAWMNELVDWHCSSNCTATTTNQPVTTNTVGRSGRTTKSTYRTTATTATKRSVPVERPKAYRPTNKRRATEHDDATTTTTTTMNVLARFSGGKARSTQRLRRKRKADMLMDKEDSWRNDFAEYTPYLIGDYRTTVVNEKVRTQEAPLEQPPDLLWDAVLAAAQSMQQDLVDKQQTLNLSEIVAFIGRVHALPPAPPKHNNTLDAAMNALWNACQGPMRNQAILMDLWVEEGVLTEVLRKQLTACAKDTTIVLDDTDDRNRQLSVVMEWQTRVDAAAGQDPDYDDGRHDILTLEGFAEEARAHGFRSKGLVALEAKLEKAYQLRDRIIEWKTSGTKETIKFLGSLVRDIGRLRLLFPEAMETKNFHKDVETWVDRANIAIRSRITLSEIKQLLHSGLIMPLNLSEYTEKLQTRVDLAEAWLSRFRQDVPSDNVGDVATLDVMQRVRQVLANGGHVMLHELASEGSRMPVDLETVKILQLELDARTWSSKALICIPSGGEASKRGKLEDLQDRLAKANTLRDRLVLSEEEKSRWVLEGEEELQSIVEKAEHWFDKNEILLDGDARKPQDRLRLSISDLRAIVSECESIFVNFGSSGSKVTKILGQAERWLEKYSPLLRRCNLVGSITPYDTIVEIDEMVEACRDSEDVPIELDEAAQLGELTDQVRNWFDKATVVIGKKRQRRNSKADTLSAQELLELIEMAPTLPVETTPETEQLQAVLNSVQVWQRCAAGDLEVILDEFLQLRIAVTEAYGSPSEFSRDKTTDHSNCTESESSVHTDSILVENDLSFEKETKAKEDVSHCESISTMEIEDDVEALTTACDSNVCNLIRKFDKEAKLSCIRTPEGDIAVELQKVSLWFARSLKYLETQRDVFDKRFFGAFDRFLAEGNTLLKAAAENEGADLDGRLKASWKDVVGDQMERLEVIRKERQAFVEWCKSAEQMVSEGKRGSFDRLRSLYEKSRAFPDSSDLVKKVSRLYRKASDWQAEAEEMLAADEKPTIHEAKSLLDAGEKLGVSCDELKELRTGLKDARNWINRVKRMKVDDGSSDSQSKELQALLDEHDELVVEVADDVAKLQQAIKNYCICRKPYDGFMIGCDSCDEWYHGTCVGISESKAGRCEKYSCIRCSVTRVFTSSASSVVGVIRKWVSMTDRKRARQVEAQKLQRKIRKESKDIVALQEERVAVELYLTNAKKNAATGTIEETQELADTLSSLNLPATLDNSADIAPEAISVVCNEEHEAEQSTDMPKDGEAEQLEYDIAETQASIEAQADAVIAELQADHPTSYTAAHVLSESLGQQGPTENELHSTIAETQASIEAQADAVIAELQAGPPASYTASHVLSESLEQLGPTESESHSTSGVEGIWSDDHFSQQPTLEAAALLEDSSSDQAVASVALKTKKKAIKMPKSIDGALYRLEKIAESIEQCEARLDDFARQSIERRNVHELEDANHIQLRQWCISVRSKVVCPSTMDQAEKSRPNLDGSMSRAMQEVMHEAKATHMERFVDVQEVLNSFKCMVWSIRATAVLSKQPSLEEVDSLLESAVSLEFIDEKALRTFKSISQRAHNWNGKVMRAIGPMPGERKPFNIDFLKELVSSVDEIPLFLPLHSRLLAVIEDKGLRHCLCGGPSDGRFMLSCDKCDRWYHGHCVNITQKDSESIIEWICQPCLGGPGGLTVALNWKDFHEKFDANVAKCHDDISQASSKAQKMWPPFGLLDSETARAALGDECVAVLDTFESTETFKEPGTPQVAQPQAKVKPVVSRKPPPVASTKPPPVASTKPPPVATMTPPPVFSMTPPPVTSYEQPPPVTSFDQVEANRNAMMQVMVDLNNTHTALANLAFPNHLTGLPLMTGAAMNHATAGIELDSLISLPPQLSSAHINHHSQLTSHHAQLASQHSQLCWNAASFMLNSLATQHAASFRLPLASPIELGDDVGVLDESMAVPLGSTAAQNQTLWSNHCGDSGVDLD
jgi:hypothetical protein